MAIPFPRCAACTFVLKEIKGIFRTEVQDIANFVLMTDHQLVMVLIAFDPLSDGVIEFRIK